jgi:phosphatidylinositol glycan class K
MGFLSTIFCVFLWVLTASAADLNKNVWVVILNTSRYWFNYRHAANAFSVYQAVKELGIEDDRIILMNALDIANEERNADPGIVHFSSARGTEKWAYDDIDVDYADSEVSAVTFTSLLTNRPRHWNIPKQQLQSNENSSILIYMAGHGGDEFFKFHDSEELSAQDLAHAFQEMHEQKRYKEVLFILDTCQASTMANYIQAPNIMTLASSVKGENSYAFQTEDDVGVAIADRFTYSLSDFIRGNTIRRAGRGTLKRSLSLHDMQRSFLPQVLHSTAVLIPSPGTADPRSIKLYRFFGGEAETPGAAGTGVDEVQVLHVGGSGGSRSTAAQRRAVVENMLHSE